MLEEFLLPKGGLGLVVVAYPRDEDENANGRDVVRDASEIDRRVEVEKARACCNCGDACFIEALMPEAALAAR